MSFNKFLEIHKNPNEIQKVAKSKESNNHWNNNNNHYTTTYIIVMVTGVSLTRRKNLRGDRGGFGSFPMTLEFLGVNI